MLEIMRIWIEVVEIGKEEGMYMEKILGDRIVIIWYLSEEIKREEWFKGSLNFLNFGWIGGL